MEPKGKTWTGVEQQRHGGVSRRIDGSSKGKALTRYAQNRDGWERNRYAGRRLDTRRNGIVMNGEAVSGDG